MLKAFYLASFFLFVSIHLCMGQIAGLTGSKISAYSNDFLARGAGELEPNLGGTWTSGFWDDNGDFLASDTTNINSYLQWRASFALTDKIEVAFQAPSDFSSLGLGAKMFLFGNEKSSLGIMAGWNLVLGNRNSIKNKAALENLSTGGLGLIFSHTFDEKSSIDFNIQNQFYFTQIENETFSTNFINAEYGYYATDNLYLVLGAGYQFGKIGPQTQSNNFMVIPGFLLQFAENYDAVFNISYTLAGKNAGKALGFNFSLTTFLE